MSVAKLELLLTDSHTSPNYSILDYNLTSFSTQIFLFQSTLTFPMSPKSSTGSKGRQPRGPFPQAALENLPLEIKDQILSYLPRADLYNLLLTSPSLNSLNEAITLRIYHKPEFPTTYRFAQFVTTVSHSKRYADMVKILDISELYNTWTEFATWKEWKYRDQPLYAARPPLPLLANRNCCYLSHPTRGPSTMYEDVSVLPTGAVVHVLLACQNIRFRLHEHLVANESAHVVKGR